jgi:hypothetical protein
VIWCGSGSTFEVSNGHHRIEEKREVDALRLAGQLKGGRTKKAVPLWRH